MLETCFTLHQVVSAQRAANKKKYMRGSCIEEGRMKREESTGARTPLLASARGATKGLKTKT